MANKMHGLVHLKLELILSRDVLIFCNIGEILKNLSLIWKSDRCTETVETGLDPRLSWVLSRHHVQTMLIDLVKQDCYNLLQSNNWIRFFEILEENKLEFRVTKMVLIVTHDLRTMYILFHNVLSLRKNIGFFGKW